MLGVSRKDIDFAGSLAMVILNVIGIYMRVERFFYIERPFDSCVLSYLASMQFEGHITEQTTVKWSIENSA